jgi:O-antigen/teichoic acid export membrane protein
MKQRAITVNFVFNLVGAALPLATALITIPIYISHIGAARYGILAIIWVLLGYFGFLDFGLSRASVNALSRLNTAGPQERSRVLVTALFANLVLGLLAGLILYLLSGFLLRRFANLSPDLEAEALAAMPWIALMMPVALISAIGSGAIESREHFLAAGLFQAFGGMIGQVAPVVFAILFGPSLTIVIPAAFMGRALSTAMIWCYVLWIEHPVHLRSFDRSQLRELLGYGAWVSVSTGITPLLESFDQVLIGTLLGPADVAHYSVPWTMATRSLLAVLALVKTIFPRLSRLSADDAKRLATRTIVTLAFAFGAVCGPAIILAQPLLILWVGRDFAESAGPVAQFVLIGSWANGIGLIPYALMQGQRRPDITAKIHLVEALPFVAILYVFVMAFGLPGAALAWSLRTVADCILMLWFGQCMSPYLGRMLPAVALIGGSWIAARLLPADPITLLLASAAAGVAFVAAGLLLDPGFREAAAASLSTVRQYLPRQRTGSV